jgi:hypothetical protein
MKMEVQIDCPDLVAAIDRLTAALCRTGLMANTGLPIAATPAFIASTGLPIATTPILPVPAPTVGLSPDADQVVWSDERHVLLDELFPSAMPKADVLARIKALPGATLTDKAIMMRAQRRGLKRPRGMPGVTHTDLASRPRPARVWSSERNAVLLQHYPTAMAIPDMVALVNALPGKQIDGGRLMEQASGYLKLRRRPTPAQNLPSPAVAPPASKPPAATPPVAAPTVAPVAPTPDIVDETGQVPAPFMTIRRWASTFRIDYDGANIAAVNKMRLLLGRAPFIQVETPMCVAAE